MLFALSLFLRKCCSALRPGMKIAGFAIDVYLDEVAHHEPPHLDLHCLRFSLLILNII